MKKIICIAAAMLLGGCAAMKEASKSVDIEVDWYGIVDVIKNLF